MTSRHNQQQPQRYPISRRAQRTTSAYDADTVDDDEESDEEMEDAAPFTSAHTPRSAIPYRYTTQQQPDPRRTHDIPARASAPTRQQYQQPGSRSNRGLVPTATPDEPATRAPRHRWHPLLFVGIGLFIMVMGYLLVGALSAWWQTTWDGWQYGYPRTYQTDAVVGHNDSPTHPSHFIAINLHSHVEVIEFPGGDVTHARVYVGPTLIGAGDDLAPVTLTFKDVNGDGKLDMIVSVGGTIAVFINDSGQFRPLRPGEQVTL